MTIKIAVLNTGDTLIADVKEAFYEEKLVCYIFENPCKFTVNGIYKISEEEDLGNKYSISLSRWPSLSKETTIEVVMETIVTLVDPVDDLKQLYEIQILGKEEEESSNEHQDVSFTE